MPGPSSLTRMTTDPASGAGAAATVHPAPAGAWRRAFSSRLTKTCSSRSWSAHTGPTPGSTLDVHPAGVGSGGAGHRGVEHQRQVAPVGVRPGGCRRRWPTTSSRSATSRRIRSDSAAIVSRKRRWASGAQSTSGWRSVSAQPWMAVSGVRSSWLSRDRNARCSRCDRRSAWASRVGRLELGPLQRQAERPGDVVEHVGGLAGLRSDRPTARPGRPRPSGGVERHGQHRPAPVDRRRRRPPTRSAGRRPSGRRRRRPGARRRPPGAASAVGTAPSVGHAGPVGHSLRLGLGPRRHARRARRGPGHRAVAGVDPDGGALRRQHPAQRGERGVEAGVHLLRPGQHLQHAADRLQHPVAPPRLGEQPLALDRRRRVAGVQGDELELVAAGPAHRRRRSPRSCRARRSCRGSAPPTS